MSELFLKDIKSSVDDKYMGFKLPGSRAIPVHIYSGVSRIICGYTLDIKNIQRLSYVYNAQGKTPVGGDTPSVYRWLVETDRLNKTVKESDLHTLRLFLQKILNSDKAVFSGSNTSMVSYTSGSDLFVTGKSMYEDAGELIGELINQSCHELSAYIKEILQNRKDPISLLFTPVVDDDNTEKKLYCFKSELPPCFTDKKNKNAQEFLESIKISGQCLLSHLKMQENKLNVLRQFNLFCMFHLFRFMANVEYLYCNKPKNLFLLDFADSGTSSISRMSALTFKQVHRSLAKFYKWGLAQRLSDIGWDKDSLMEEETPSIEENKPNKNHQELDVLWDYAKKESSELSEQEAMTHFAATIFNMLERDGKVSPTTYMKLFGIHAGILIQGNRALTARFKPKPDMIEMIIRCCVEPGETLRGVKLKRLLLERMNVIIGGEESDVEALNNSGCKVTSDDDSLIINYERFAEKLRVMNFAETMADGILQINLGGQCHE